MASHRIILLQRALDIVWSFSQFIISLIKDRESNDKRHKIGAFHIDFIGESSRNIWCALE